MKELVSLAMVAMEAVTVAERKKCFIKNLNLIDGELLGEKKSRNSKSIHFERNCPKPKKHNIVRFHDYHPQSYCLK